MKCSRGGVPGSEYRRPRKREGYVAAFRNPEVMRAIRSGPLGRIAVTYFEWSGQGLHWQVVPWSLIASRDDADAFAARLEVAPPMSGSSTSISSALAYAVGQFGAAFNGYRQTIDVSGDGVNNSGYPVDQVRASVVRRGITINGYSP